jgi:hypothetical protein
LQWHSVPPFCCLLVEPACQGMPACMCACECTCAHDMISHLLLCIIYICIICVWLPKSIILNAI